MTKKRKKKTKKVTDLNRPFKIKVLGTALESGLVSQIEYICDGVIKLAQISYLRVSENATEWELKHIAKWLEKYHPNRTHIIDDPEYMYWYQLENLGLDPDSDDWIPNLPN